MKRALFFIFLLVCISTFAQESLSNGYKDFTFGLTKDRVKDKLKSSSEFQEFREEVLTVRIDPDKEILKIDGRPSSTSFITKGYFHFNKDSLYHIYLKISPKRVGYYSLLKSLTKKYGNPTSLEPKKAIWTNDSVRVQIEKPCIIKYTDIKVWDSLNTTDEELIRRNQERKNRNEFLDDL